MYAFEWTQSTLLLPQDLSVDKAVSCFYQEKLCNQEQTSQLHKNTMSLFAPVPSQKRPPFLGKVCAPPGLPIAPLFSLKDGTSQTESVHQNHLEGFLNPLWPKPRVSDSEDLRGVLIIYFSNRFPGDVDTAGPKPNFGKHDPKNCYTDFALLSQIPEPLPPGCFFP